MFGTEKANDTVKLAKMNLAVHGLSGDIRESNTDDEDPHKAVVGNTGRFDFVMANPPFSVGVDKERVNHDPRFPFGIPTTDNANYLWIQHFYSALNERGRAGFVMANSAGDARGTELEIRKKLIEQPVAATRSIRSAPTSSTPSPCRAPCGSSTRRRPRASARMRCCSSMRAAPTCRPAGRSATSCPSRSSFSGQHRATVAPRGGRDRGGSQEMLRQQFPEGAIGIAGVCKVATLAEIEAQGWKLNLGGMWGLLIEVLMISTLPKGWKGSPKSSRC